MTKPTAPKPTGTPKPATGSSRNSGTKTPTFTPPRMPPIKPGKSGI